MPIATTTTTSGNNRHHCHPYHHQQQSFAVAVAAGQLVVVVRMVDDLWYQVPDTYCTWSLASPFSSNASTCHALYCISIR